jgi:Spy/CpxP family protein refolding chaperone
MLLPAVLGLALAAPVAVFAQQAVPAAGQFGAAAGTHHRGGMMRGLLRGVQLSDTQRSQIKQILGQFRTSHQGSRPTPQERQQLRQRIMRVLTPQQRAQAQANIQRMRERRAERENGENASPSPQATPEE